MIKVIIFLYTKFILIGYSVSISYLIWPHAILIMKQIIASSFVVDTFVLSSHFNIIEFIVLCLSIQQFYILKTNTN